MFTLYTRRFGRWTPSYTGTNYAYAFSLLRDAQLPSKLTDGNGYTLAANTPTAFN